MIILPKKILEEQLSELKEDSYVYEEIKELCESIKVKLRLHIDSANIESPFLLEIGNETGLIFYYEINELMYIFNWLCVSGQFKPALREIELELKIAKRRAYKELEEYIRLHVQPL